jgi:probable addiction module antidote protein
MRQPLGDREREMKKTVDYQKFLMKQLRNDEALREAYLNEALAHEDQRLILAAIRNVAQATGGLTKLAKVTGLNRQNLYRTLSIDGNPTWQRIEKIFDGLGYPLRAVSKKSLAALEAGATYKTYIPSPKSRDRFMRLLENPPAPNAKLKAAARRYRKMKA